MTPLDTYERDHKRPVRPGDRVSVAGSDREQGWTATVVRLVDDGGQVVAVVTRPKGRGGVRHVDADRLTRRYGR